MILDAHWRPLQGKAIPLKDLQIKQKPKLIFFLQMPGNRVSNTLETKFFWGRPPTTPPPPPSRGFAPSALAVRAFGAQRCAPPLLRCFRRPCIASKGVKDIVLALVSNPNAMFKSYKLSVPLAEKDKIIQANMWPYGVCVV